MRAGPPRHEGIKAVQGLSMFSQDPWVEKDVSRAGWIMRSCTIREKQPENNGPPTTMGYPDVTNRGLRKRLCKM